MELNWAAKLKTQLSVPVKPSDSERGLHEDLCKRCCPRSPFLSTSMGSFLWIKQGNYSQSQNQGKKSGFVQEPWALYQGSQKGVGMVREPQPFTYYYPCSHFIGDPYLCPPVWAPMTLGVSACECEPVEAVLERLGRPRLTSPSLCWRWSVSPLDHGFRRPHRHKDPNMVCGIDGIQYMLHGIWYTTHKDPTNPGFWKPP